ncbi:imidazolonepropionase [Rapidithrix thailandica]|uniref:Imidazolonepropionase n=1 Tax=Rapidithrix thailandica TaxID=413964 RepID=A0AAW9S569_9BACT
MKNIKLIGPFRQILTMANLPEGGPIKDDSLELIENGGVLIQGEHILKVGTYKDLYLDAVQQGASIEEVEEETVLLPGLIDCHTHMCFGGSRHRDYSLRVAGVTYQEILQQGGGIHDTVQKTREASQEALSVMLHQRANRHLQDGITTCEVKSGYGLSVDAELKMLRSIQEVNSKHTLDMVSTCLAAHVCPKEFDDKQAYLQHIVQELLPKIQKEGLSDRVDIFVEEEAFNVEISREYLRQAKAMGFQLTLHADQFSTGGSRLAAELGALSADHLEASGEEEVKILAKSGVMPVVLPGASLGLGMHFAPARKILDWGGPLAISTDWNPGSGPMGDLLVQASLLGVYEKLSMAETLAGITARPAQALGLQDRGILQANKLADMVAFPCGDVREICYHQGKMKPVKVWKRGNEIHGKN